MLEGVLSKNFHEIRKFGKRNLSFSEPTDRSIRGTTRGVFPFSPVALNLNTFKRGYQILISHSQFNYFTARYLDTL